jgi:hypothetical protein
LLVGALGCSDSTDPGTPDGGELARPPSNATIKITSPAEGDTVPVDSSLTFPITYEVGNFELKPQGACGDTAECGHVEIFVDGYQCAAPGGDFNALTDDATTAQANLNYCPAPTGPHTVTAELHYDDGSVVVGPSGKYVSQTISLKSAPPPPAIAIDSPATGSAVFLGDDADRTAEIAFSTTSLTLQPAPGMCNGDPACGFLILNIDGDACDDPDAPGPLNNYGATEGSIAARFGLCSVPEGQHTVTLTVMDDTGSGPLMVNGAPLMASVDVVAAAMPSLAITSPTDGATVTMGADAYQSVSIAFSTANLTLEPYPGSGTCTGNPACGVLTLTIDGDACNDPDLGGAPFNNYGATTSPIDAHFAMCPVPAGQHTVGLAVWDDGATGPIMINGAPLSTEITITTN